MKEKKTLILLIMIAVVGIVGLTIAYFTNTTSISNLFSTNPYGTTVTEVFESPDNWLPGTTTPKSIEVTNSGSVDEAVRISYTEKWKSKKGNTLSGLIDSNGNLTDEEENSEHAAIINFSDNGDFTYSNGYYYYNYKLAPNEKTSTLIDSVTFNSKVKNDSNCEETESNGKKTITCNSTQDGYDGATYILTFTIETVQYDKYKQAWGVDVAILSEQTLFCDAFEVGEVVTYNNADYYVLKDSSTSDDYVTLLKKDPLTANEVNQYSNDYVSQDGEYPYFESDTCNENDETDCNINYDTSDVKKIVDGWSSSFSDDLVEIDGYKTRLIGENEIDVGFTIHDTVINSQSVKEIQVTNSEISDLFILNEQKYWSNFQIDDSNSDIIVISDDLKIKKIYDKFYVRPVINLKKSAINGACYINKNNEYLTCIEGEKVVYNNDLYYIINQSDSNKKYVQLLKAYPLTAREINNYSNEYISENGEFPFDISETCNENNKSSCYSEVNYEDSSIKKLVDNWSVTFSDDLVDVNGYKASLPNRDEISNDYDWKFINKSYWSINPSWIYYFIISKPNENIWNNRYDKNYVRPVIYLRKSAIEIGCGRGNIEDYIDSNYAIGKTISYKNNDYCVIKDSDDDEDYITLIKQDPLSYDELVTYNNGYEIERASYNNDIGTMSYYKSDDCYYNSDTDKNTTGCSSNYDTSNIKNVVDNWGNSFNNDLVEVDGYKARLNTYDELIDLGYILRYHGTEMGHFETDSDTKCVGYSYWFNYGAVFGSLTQTKTYEFYPVRPVINLKKCAIDSTC